MINMTITPLRGDNRRIIMLPFAHYNPVRVEFGPGKSREVGPIAARFGKKAMLVTYEQHDFFAALLDDIHKNLADAGVTVIDFFKVQANPLLCHIREAVDICRSEKVDVVIALGGGSVMDSVKLIAAGVPYEGDLWQMFVSRHDRDVAIPPKTSIPKILIPTLPATSSEMNNIGVATNDVTHEKQYVWADTLYADVSVVDPELTCSLPAFQTAAGAVDAISHVLEAYFSGDQNSPVHDRMQEGLVIGIMDELRAVLADPKNVQHRANIQWASTLAWNGWMQCGLAAPTPMHQMGHVLSARYNTTHGVTLAIFMASFLPYSCRLNAERAARCATFGARVFGMNRADYASDEAMGLAALDKLTAFIREVGLPTKLSEVGIPESDFEAIADDIVRLGCNAEGNLPSIPPIGRDGILDILRLAK
ncbi:MAG: iron-containing alcohol dehydrogenase [Clostridia bacterium]|nr:iron-containing alcohol dehydrogenase [Clostridia bacterium]